MVQIQIGNYKVTRYWYQQFNHIIFKETLIKMKVDLQDLKPLPRSFTSFNGTSNELIGTIRLIVFVGGVNRLVKFSVIGTLAPYMVFLGLLVLLMNKYTFF